MLRAVDGWHGGVGAVARRFLGWWLAELGGMLPLSLRTAFAPGGQRLLLAVSQDELTVTLESASERQLLGRFTLQAERVDPQISRLARRPAERVLCLPPAKVLRRRIELPLATEENLRQVLGFELDRETPLSAEQAYFDYRLLERDAVRRVLRIELLVAPRAAVDEARRHLERFGLAPHRATVIGDDGVEADLNLLPEPERARSTRVPRVINALLALVALVLLGLALALPLAHKREALARLEPLVREARNEAVAARELRDSLTQLSAEARFVLQRRLALTPALDLINELTQLLPDDTWARQLILRNGELQLMGESDSAEPLLQLLEASPLLSNVRFRSPVVQDERAGLERFHLSADYAVGGDG